MAATTAGSAAQVFALFRSILRVHRSKLPTPMREMGDRYVIEEFKAHLKADTTKEQWERFGAEWHRYRDMLAGAADLSPTGTVLDKDALVTGIDRGGDISEDVVAQMSQDQRERLQKVRQEAVKLGRELTSSEKI